jgi:hypothetical protein
MSLLRKIVLGIAVIALLLVAITFGWQWYRQWARPDIARDGGTILVYEVDELQWPEGRRPDDYSVEKLAAKLKKRLDPDDDYGVSVRPVSDDRVEVTLPRQPGGRSEEWVQEVKDLISRQGSMKFVILANMQDDRDAIDVATQYFVNVASDPRKQEALKAAARNGDAPPPPGPPNGRFFHTVKGDCNYKWIELGRNERIASRLDNASEHNEEPIRGSDGQPMGGRVNTFWQMMARAREKHEAVERDGFLYWSRTVGDPDRLPERDRGKKYEYFQLTRDAGLDDQGRPVPDLTGEHLTRAVGESDKNLGQVVSFRFDSEGARLLSDLTTKNVDRRMAIVLDDQIMSAPRIQGPITGGSGVINGNYTREDVDRMATVLRSGALPATLKPSPVSEITVEPRK